MKRKIELFKQELERREQKRQETQRKLDDLQTQRNNLTAQIETAIAAEDPATAERLIRQRNELNVSVELQTLTLANLTNQSLDVGKVSAAYRDELNDTEKQIAALTKKANHAKAELIESACEIGNLRSQATNNRWEYLQLINIINDPDFKRKADKFPVMSIPVDGFPFVSAPYLLPNDLKDDMTPEQIQAADFI